MTTQRFRFRNYDVDSCSDIEWATPRGATRVKRLEDGRIEVIFEDEETTVIVNDLSELNKEINKSFEEQSEADTTPLESRKALSKQEIVKFLIDNCTDEDGDLDLSGLDFSEFNGDVNISGMKVKKNLYQCGQNVKGELWQCVQRVKGNLYQREQQVEGALYQDYQKVKGFLFQSWQKVGGDLRQHRQQVEGDLLQDDQQVGGNLYQGDQQVEGNLSQDCQCVKGSLWQNCQDVKGNLYQGNQSVGGCVYPEKGVE